MDLLGNLRQTLAERMEHYRDLRDWTQHDLAAACEVSVSRIRGYEQKKRWPDPEILERMASELGISPIDLLTAEDERPKPTPEEALEVLRDALKKT